MSLAVTIERCTQPSHEFPGGSGRQGDVLTVTITGSGLSGATGLDFGDGIEITQLTVVSDSEISAEISIEPDAAAGKRDVTVTTPGGTGTVLGGFTVSKAGTGVHLWIFVAGVAGGLAGLGLLASLGVGLRRRRAK